MRGYSIYHLAAEDPKSRMDLLGCGAHDLSPVSDEFLFHCLIP